MKNSDDMPVSRFERATMLGSLGIRMGARLAKAGAQGVLANDELRDELWDRAHREGARDLVRTLGSMRGLAAKFGQLLSHSPTGLPKDYFDGMLQLTHQVPSMSYGMVKTQIYAELGGSPTAIFRVFEKHPFAAASLGQVHRAITRDGREVAVKVQYPAVEQSVRSDLDNIELVVGPISRVIRMTNAREAFREVADHLIDELDYEKEAANIRYFRRVFANDEGIRIPAVLDELSTRRILTMEMGTGLHVDRYLATNPSLEERRALGLAQLRFVWTSILKHGLLHADPNPGNFLFAPTALTVLDFGCVKRFDEPFLRDLEVMLRAAMDGRDEVVDAAMEQIGLVPINPTDELRAQLRAISRAWMRPLAVNEFDWGEPNYLARLIEAQDVARHLLTGYDHFSLPKDWFFYGRQLVGGTFVLNKLGACTNLRALIAPLLERTVA